MSNYYKSVIALIFTHIFYGITYILAKNVMPDYISAMALTMARIIISIVLFWFVCLFFRYEKIERKDLIRIFIAALFGVSMNQYLFMEGLNLSTPIDGAIMITSTPVLVILISAFVLNEKITPLKFAGLILGATGAVVIILYKGKADFGSQHMVGNLLLLINSFSYAIYLVIMKPVMYKYNVMHIMKWVFLAGFVFILPFGFRSMISENWLSLPSNVILSLLYITVITTFLNYYLTNYALKYLSTTSVSIFSYIQPVVVVLAAAFIGIEKIVWIQIFAGIMIFTGVFLVSQRHTIL